MIEVLSFIHFQELYGPKDLCQHCIATRTMFFQNNLHYFNIEREQCSKHAVPYINMNNLDLLMVVYQDGKEIMQMVPYEHPPLFYSCLVDAIQCFLEKQCAEACCCKFIYENNEFVRLIFLSGRSRAQYALLPIKEVFIALLETAKRFLIWHEYYCKQNYDIVYKDYFIQEDSEYFRDITDANRLITLINTTLVSEWWPSLCNLYIPYPRIPNPPQAIRYKGYCDVEDQDLRDRSTLSKFPLTAKGFLYLEYDHIRLLSNTALYVLHELLFAFINPLYNFIIEKKDSYVALSDGTTFYFSYVNGKMRITLITPYHHTIIDDYNYGYTFDICKAFMSLLLQIKGAQKNILNIANYFEEEYETMRKAKWCVLDLYKIHSHIPIKPPIIYSTYRGAEWW